MQSQYALLISLPAFCLAYPLSPAWLLKDRSNSYHHSLQTIALLNMTSEERLAGIGIHSMGCQPRSQIVLSYPSLSKTMSNQNRASFEPRPIVSSLIEQVQHILQISSINSDSFDKLI
ncbi:hypothetical protein F5882DRAFT_408644 [Hyaloscypha sp. PMI_1271]|nr:hypothetical protein F5882DRAFT_408644 [Hyaloscypha sp. PMI_1271]